MLICAPPELEARAARLIAGTGVAMVDPDEWFAYTGGIRSPVYLQIRDLTKYAPQWMEVVRCMAEFIRWAMTDAVSGSQRIGEPIKGVYGVPEGATLLSGALAYELGVGAVRIHQERKAYGIGQTLFGIRPHERACVLEDTSSTGAAVVTLGVVPLRACGVRVEHAFLFASHGLGVAETFERRGITGFCLCRSEVIFGEVLQRLQHDERTRRIVRRWFEDPIAASNAYVASHSIVEGGSACSQIC